MRIELLLTPQCFITDLVGDLHDATPIRAGQTRLILAKISLGKSRPTSSSCSTSSADLLTDLESHLGDTYHPYLTVRLSYKHSGFQNSEGNVPAAYDKGSHITHLQTDVVTVIKRHNSQSAWSPRTSQMAYQPSDYNPLMRIVRQHLPSDEAAGMLAKLVDGHHQYPFLQPAVNIGGPSEDTAMPVDNSLCSKAPSIVRTSLHDVIALEGPLSSSEICQSSTGSFARFKGPPRALSDETDPARKIWCEMRRSSRGRPSRNAWGGLSNDEYTEDDLTPTRKSFSAATSSTFDGPSSLGSTQHANRHHREESIDYERNLIMDIALKNKRSLGAETLRSMAPSIAKSAFKSKSGTVGRLGLGSGKTWGWGPPWW